MILYHGFPLFFVDNLKGLYWLGRPEPFQCEKTGLASKQYRLVIPQLYIVMWLDYHFSKFIKNGIVAGLIVQTSIVDIIRLFINLKLGHKRGPTATIQILAYLTFRSDPGDMMDIIDLRLSYVVEACHGFEKAVENLVGTNEAKLQLESLAVLLTRSRPAYRSRRGRGTH